MNKFFRLLVLLPLTLTLTACPFDDDDDSDAATQPTALLRVLHGSPDAPNVDVLVNDGVVLADVPYKAGSGYLNVPTGGFDVAVNVAGTDTTALSLTNVELVADTEYTVIAANSVASIEAILLDDSTTIPVSGNLLVRVVHATAIAPAVDVYVTAPDASLSSTTPAVTNAAYKDASAFIEIPAADYRIRVTATGDTTVLFDSGTVSLPEGAELTIVALPSENVISPIDLVALTGDTEAPTIELNDNRAQLRAAHLSPHAPNVDVYVDDNRVLTNVAFQAVSDYLLVQDGLHQLKITPTGSNTPVIDIPLDLAALSSTTAAAVDFVASIEPLAIDDDLTPPAAGNAHVRVVHASPDAPNVDVLVDGNKVLTNVPFKGVSDYLPLVAGSYNIKVNVTNTTTSVIDATLNLSDGAIYTVIATGAVASIEAIIVQDN